jgi:hypothetical protein
VALELFGPSLSGLRFFESCEVAGRVTNPYGVENEETRDHPQVFLCRGPRRPWPELWAALRSFG